MGHHNPHHHHPHQRLKHTDQNSDSAPVEFEIGSMGGWRLVGIAGVPPIRRRAGSPTDRAREQFMSFRLSELSNPAKFDEFTQTVAAVWSKEMPGLPNCYVVSSSLPGLSRSITSSPTSSDRAAAAAVLMRHGFLVVDGNPMPGVTRADRRISADGTRFIKGEEGDGSLMYWPHNPASGVTLGAGYDMGHRGTDEVARDLVNIGIDSKVANQVALGAGQLDEDAKDFVSRHNKDLSLSRAQQDALFCKVVPTYELKVSQNLSKSLKGRLYQHEFDALVSLAYNITKYNLRDAVRDVNKLDFVSAIPAWMTLIGGGNGIRDRRRRETMIFENAIYICKALPAAQ